MASVYSTRFAAVQGLNGTLDLVFPAGFIVVLRDLDVYNGSGGVASVFLRGNAGQAIYVHRWEVGDGASHEQWRGRQVLTPPEGASITCSLAMDVTLSGYLLSAP